MGNDEMLTVQDAAIEAGVSEEAIRKAMRRQRLPYVEKYGRKLIERTALTHYRANVKMGRPRKSAAI